MSFPDSISCDCGDDQPACKAFSFMDSGNTLNPNVASTQHCRESMSSAKSGIQQTTDGSSYIPASKRADGTTRKEIRVRPGYRPPEDVETYKNRSAESWKNRGSAGVPGADQPTTNKASDQGSETKSRNAKRREAARKRAEVPVEETELTSKLQQSRLGEEEKSKVDWRNPEKLATNEANPAAEEGERQKKIRNVLKKLKAARELKDKKMQGEKLSHDQLLKIGKEPELLRDLQKLDYDGPEVHEATRNGGSLVVDEPP